MKKPQLFLLHFAGGNCYSFQFLVPYLKDFEVICPELPGRGRRMEEALLKDFDRAVGDVYRQMLRRSPTQPFMIYGHSMGAYMALRISAMLEKDGCPPSQLFVSGNAGPGVRESRQRYLLNQADFWQELKTLGGLPKEFFENPELFEMYEPILRADFQVAECHSLDKDDAVSIPLFAMMGSEEENVEHIGNWSRYTGAAFQHEVFPGGHFFIHPNAARIANIINKAYNNLKVYL